MARIIIDMEGCDAATADAIKDKITAKISDLAIHVKKNSVDERKRGPEPKQQNVTFKNPNDPFSPIISRGPRICNQSLNDGQFCHEEAEDRYSLDIFAGYYCDRCWDESGYRKEGREGYDYLDAGEYYDEEEY